MNNLVIINAYPNNEYKISLLEQQLVNFKQLGVKILVISGCDVPEQLRSSIDYLIINTDNIRIDNDHTYKCIVDLKLNDTAYWYTRFHNSSYALFGSHVNVTICKNIKLSFKMAQMLGYKSVFYTEDDNIFKPQSFPLINECFDQLNSNKYKIIGCVDKFSDTDCVYTTYFASNIDFLLQTFVIPDTKEEYYNDENIIKYKLHKPFEVSFYQVLKNNLIDLRNILPEIRELESQNAIDANKSQRLKTKDWVYNTITHVLPKPDKTKYIVLHNKSYVLPEEQRETIEVEVYLDDVFVQRETLPPCVGFYYKISDDVKKVKFKVLSKFEKEYDTDYDSIKYNGLFFSDYL